MTQTRARPAVVVVTSIARSVDSFYGQIIDEFQSRGYEVHVVTSDGPEVPRLREHGYAVHIIRIERTISLLLDLRALWALVRILRHIRPEVVFGGTPKAALLSMVASRLNRIPRRAYFLQGLRLEGTTGAEYRLLSAMEWFTCWNSHVVIAVSASLADLYLELRLAAGRPIAVPHHGSSHGVDTEHFRPVLRDVSFIQELSMDPELPTVIFIGRLTADKGLDSLIDALDLLRLEGVEFQVLVIGPQDEADSSYYRERLEACLTPVWVISQSPDVRPYIASADFLVLPTRREGMPNVVLEAAAMGIPSVTTTATGAIDSLLDGETGILVPPNDPRALSTAMSRLLRDPALRQRMGASARCRVVSLFQPRDVARTIVDVAIGEDNLLSARENENGLMTRSASS